MKWLIDTIAEEFPWLLVGLGVGVCLMLLLTGCGNIDVNGYRAKAAPVGQPIHCKGACK